MSGLVWKVEEQVHGANVDLGDDDGLHVELHVYSDGEWCVFLNHADPVDGGMIIGEGDAATVEAGEEEAETALRAFADKILSALGNLDE